MVGEILSPVPNKKAQEFECSLCAPRTSIASIQLCNGPPFTEMERHYERRREGGREREEERTEE